MSRKALFIGPFINSSHKLRCSQLKTGENAQNCKKIKSLVVLLCALCKTFAPSAFRKSAGSPPWRQNAMPLRPRMSLTSSSLTNGLSSSISRCLTSTGRGSSSHQRLATQPQSCSRYGGRKGI